MSKETESVDLVVVQKLENALSAKTNVADDAQATPELEPEVNLCVKVPLSLRCHWAAEAISGGHLCIYSSSYCFPAAWSGNYRYM